MNIYDSKQRSNGSPATVATAETTTIYAAAAAIIFANLRKSQAVQRVYESEFAVVSHHIEGKQADESRGKTRVGIKSVAYELEKVNYKLAPEPSVGAGYEILRRYDQPLRRT